MKQAFLAATILISANAGACINDRDTLAFELRNVDAIKRVRQETDYKKKGDAAQEIALKAIGGRFERFPAKYYEMRIARLEALASLTALEYDDLAVAYERIGKTDKALEVLLASKPYRKTKDDGYRFHANYGTLLVHKWLQQKDRADKKALKQSIAEIEAALKINPNSHFGREKVQLGLERLWLSGKEIEIDDGAEYVVGLAGIVMMGLAAELPDAYVLMTEQYLGAEDSLFDGLAVSRANELSRVGKGFIAPSLKPEGFSQEANQEVTKAFQDLRADGDKVHQARLAYMDQRLSRGEHPDTHPEFWKKWTEPPLPVLKRIPDPYHAAAQKAPAILMMVGLGALIGVVVIIVAYRLRKRRLLRA